MSCKPTANEGDPDSKCPRPPPPPPLASLVAAPSTLFPHGIFDLRGAQIGSLTIQNFIYCNSSRPCDTPRPPDYQSTNYPSSGEQRSEGQRTTPNKPDGTHGQPGDPGCAQIVSFSMLRYLCQMQT